MPVTRRQFCKLAGATVTSVALDTGCNDFGPLNLMNDGRLTVRPLRASNAREPGKDVLWLDRDRDAILQIPKLSTKGPVPLLVMLHGATQSADEMFDYLGSIPEEAGVAVLAPNSRDTTWDAIGGYFGPDVAFINHALETTFEKAAIDPSRIAIGGFSDGASYALSLGLINGDLFGQVVGFSPGFIVQGTPHGRPRFFISHGTSDHILPIDRCSRRIVAELKEKGYSVTLREFNGDHEVPEEVAKEGFSMVAASR
jgi:phospholipase/carboxylesterase